MTTRKRLFFVNAGHIVATTFGILSGIGGLLHGIGEVLQGNVRASGIFIPSWTQGPLAVHMGGDPAITLIPNMVVTGILTLLVSLAVIIWSAAFVQRKHGGRILLLLTFALLLVGGGVGPPVVGLLAGVAGTTINAPHSWWRTHLTPGIKDALAAAFPWVFGISALNGIFLFVWHIIGVFLLGMTNADMFLVSFYLAVPTVLLSTVTGIAYDLREKQRAPGVAL